ncbi:hypothetical protein MCOR02_007064 [Pyricularia oryzae]|uniref:Glutathione hydrolase n=2 Tax=Pyricularia TaxID=48558 RepID=A0ABQ8NK37_PYRGI|nr:hypothetical protein MCOR02_007064 [Pyricularia oryzae]KAI6297806.1 hypothetical protein MCOR33_005901 [Pyricularia grisea]KAI6326144.1 hypothetical protein MCOR34_000917 [Pyricularia oryzae]KAI6362705.1 hypothetical protein MCOR32_008375 [Pyricularia oryzae]KAI6468490.1 hypothetical protein MCOR17_004098 [Pyricularia oryzae]
MAHIMASALRAQLPVALLLWSSSQLQLSSALNLQVPLIGSSHAGSRGAVASESKICSQIGIDLIAQGGNAADAMVGTNLCVGVTGMYHSGIGGGGFMLVRGPDGEYEVIDYRETAPAAAYEDMYRGNVHGSIHGGLSVGVPGELRGLEYLHSKYGSLSWRSVVLPAVQVARNGFPVTEDLVRYMKAATEPGQPNFLVEDPAWSQEFAPNGTLVGLGDIIKRGRLASTLEKIAHHGANVFYEGDIAKSMIDVIQANNGTMTLDDLKDYQVSRPRPVSVNFRGYKLWSTPSPSSGAVCLSIMKTLEQYPPEELSATPENINLTTHRLDEALRFGYGGRTSLGDPAFVPHIDELESRLLSEKSAAARRARILDNTTQPVEAYDPNTEDSSNDGRHFYANPGHGTSHIVTADGTGMTITSTTTINLLFGSLLITPDTGIILNNEMNDFSIPGVRNEFGFEPSVPNYIRPGKRPLSSITPLIAERIADGSLALSVGAAGGSRILSSTCQVAWRVLEQGLGVKEAVAEPRIHDQLMPNESWFEWAFDNSTVAGLAARGHNVSWVPPIYSAVQAVQMLEDGTLVAAREIRQKNSGGLSI